MRRTRPNLLQSGRRRRRITSAGANSRPLLGRDRAEPFASETAAQAGRTPGRLVMNKNRMAPRSSRRQVLRAGSVLGIGGLLGTHRLVPPARAAGRTLTIADVGVGDPGGDWSRFEQPTGNL